MRLSAAQKEELKAFVPLMKEKSTPFLHAGFTAFSALIFYLVSAAILSSVFDLIGTLKFILLGFVAHLALSIWNSQIHLDVPISKKWFRKVCLLTAVVVVLYLAVDLLIHIHELSMSRLMAWMVWSTLVCVWGAALYLVLTN
ncbi:hypothetical protein P4S72_04630 [Vibrio sp. PP-XX7]